MDAARFEELASAYGGRLHRWPKDEQALAQAFATTETGRIILERASGLDGLLDCYAPSIPSAALSARILRDGKMQLARRRRTRLWWSGFGLAGVGLAGALAGAIMLTVIAPMPQPEHVIFSADTTAFGDISSPQPTSDEDF